MSEMSIIGRKTKLFDNDLFSNKIEIEKKISSSSFLIVGGAGFIGQSTIKELLKRNPSLYFTIQSVLSAQVSDKLVSSSKKDD